MIYSSFYSYAMAVCERYTSNNEDALKVLNEGFLKVFKRIDQYIKVVHLDIITSFQSWLREILVHTAIEYFRKNYRSEVIDPNSFLHQLPATRVGATGELTQAQMIDAVRRLSPVYRMVFNLSIIEGLDHELIAEKLNISATASKSNLSNARQQLQNILLQQNDFFPAIEVNVNKKRSATR